MGPNLISRIPTPARSESLFVFIAWLFTLTDWEGLQNVYMFFYVLKQQHRAKPLTLSYLWNMLLGRLFEEKRLHRVPHVNVWHLQNVYSSKTWVYLHHRLPVRTDSLEMSFSESPSKTFPGSPTGSAPRGPCLKGWVILQIFDLLPEWTVLKQPLIYAVTLCRVNYITSYCI